MSALPDGWEDLTTPEGDRVLVWQLALRRRTARFAAGLAAAMALVALMFAWSAALATSSPGAVILALAIAIALAALAWWLGSSRMEIAVGGGRIVWRRRVGGHLQDLFVADHLELDMGRDADGKTLYRLDAVAGAQRRVLVRGQKSPAGPSALGAWIAREAGVPLRKAPARN